MLANSILEELEKSIPYTVIFADQAGPKPKHPYMALKVLVDNISNGHHPSILTEDLGGNVEQSATTQPTMSLSITAYGLSFDETNNLIQSAHDWFKFTGYRTLKRKGLVVASIESIMNRDSLIVDDYERRRGFDVMIRYVHVIKRETESIQSVDLEFNRIKNEQE